MIAIHINCDALNCVSDVVLPDDSCVERDLERRGWMYHPSDPEQQYCPKCWETVKQELSND